jgi:hypothetical protein
VGGLHWEEFVKVDGDRCKYWMVWVWWYVI